MATGRIIEWTPEKRTGFIEDAADQARVFFGVRTLRGIDAAAIAVGLEVDFEREQNERGPMARRVRPPGAPADMPRVAPAPPPAAPPEAPAGEAAAGGAPPAPRERRRKRERQPRGAAAGPARPGRRRPSKPGRDLLLPRVLALPRSLRDLLDAVPLERRHPGLLLDKLTKPVEDLADRREALRMAIRAARDGRWLEGAHVRRIEDLEVTGALGWERTSVSPLAIHDGRPGAVEGDWVRRHPVGGFPLIPGTSLKAIARLYAETVWLPRLREDRRAAGRREIDRIFGAELSAPEAADPARRAMARGVVAFHDAWPLGWPRVILEVATNHHRAWYEHGHPPGDWEAPVPEPFLVVAPGHAFSFAVGPRAAGVPRATLRRAMRFLDLALSLIGVGAGTARGFGFFRTRPGVHDRASAGEVAALIRLELTSPAFVAGANPRDEEGADLRVPTLRGQLRAWWRTRHAGFLEPRELRAVETAIFGGRGSASAVLLDLVPLRTRRCYPFAFRDRENPARVRPDVRERHALADVEEGGSQGLFYVAHGMDEGSRHRLFVDWGAAWGLRIRARDAAVRLPVAGGSGEAVAIPKERVLGEILAALRLLATWGGVGARARRGLGSLRADGSALQALDPEAIRASAKALRAELGCDRPFDPALASTAALETAMGAGLVIETGWTNPWRVLDRLGAVLSGFAREWKHRPEKMALGLPRRIHGPLEDGPLPHQSAWQRPEWLRVPRGTATFIPELRSGRNRFASPLHIHLARDRDGQVLVRALAFPSPYLPDAATSKTVLEAALRHLETEWFTGIERPRPKAPPRDEVHGRRDSGPREGRGRRREEGEAAAPPPPRHPVAPRKRAFGTPATVTIIGVRDKGGFTVKEEGRPEGTLRLGPSPDPLPETGATLGVFIHDDEAARPQYRWDRPVSAPPPPKRGGRPGGR